MPFLTPRASSTGSSLMNAPNCSGVPVMISKLWFARRLQLAVSTP